ncbi:hypothetical protein TIFTF001_044607 [Ficus carica]|uniref:Uncharacterized protein n=1 Tax=Ficus carica TaxID=3494 RepID=A0AA88DA95_FICCA|nr:hypothetical protein TIFTF001_044607 [Ficus carica]
MGFEGEIRGERETKTRERDEGRTCVGDWRRERGRVARENGGKSHGGGNGFQGRD